METARYEYVDGLMNSMPAAWRYRWCTGGICACMGGANCSGMLTANGVSEAEWQAWVNANPADDVKPFGSLLADRLALAVQAGVRS